MLYNPESVIKQMPAGTMIYAQIQANNQPEVAFLIREEPEIVSAFGPGPRVEIRAALLKERDAGLIPVLVAVRNELYEAWINAYQTGGGMHYLEDLCRQTMIRLLFFGAAGRLRAIGVPNALRSQFTDTLQAVRQMAPWSMSDFDEAREMLYERYPSVWALWDALGTGAQGPRLLSTREVADMMGCSVQYVQKLVTQGKLTPALPWTKRQSMWFEPEHIEEFIRSR